MSRFSSHLLDQSLSEQQKEEIESGLRDIATNIDYAARYLSLLAHRPNRFPRSIDALHQGTGHHRNRVQPWSDELPRRVCGSERLWVGGRQTFDIATRPVTPHDIEISLEAAATALNAPRPTCKENK